MKRTKFLVAVALLALTGTSAYSGGAPVDPSSYPALSEEEMGQLRWVIKLAGQDLDDFSGMEGIDQLGMTSYRYCIAFSTYFLAVEQYFKLPACPEIVRPAIDRFIQKMQVKAVWDFWEEVSRGLPNLEPSMDKPYPAERDPVAFRNIMYSGHVGHMIGLYETLYRDMKYEKPGSIAFEWSPDERYEYSYRSLNQVMYDQMTNNPHQCIECEPNACFPECNQHPVLSFLLYDKLHRTDFFKASENFLDFFLKKKMIHPRTHETAMLYLVKQDITLSNETPRYRNALDLVITPLVSLGAVSLDSAAADGWTGTFMHAWQKDYIERHYPYQKENNLVRLGDDTRINVTVWEPQLKYGFFAMLAAEVGDFETRDRLIAYADKKYSPVWQDGMLRYPYNLGKGCTNLTGKLLAMARALPRDGLWKMHNEPFDEAHFAEPALEGVDFPRVALYRAVYDRERKALVITAAPGGRTGGITAFKAIRLDPTLAWTLYVDGREIKTVSGRQEMEIEIKLDGRHDVVVAGK